MSTSDDVNPDAPPSAEQMRILLLEEQMKELSKQSTAQTGKEKEQAAFKEDFLKGQVTEAEIAMVRRLAMSAVKLGKFEAMVYSFPSDLCSDSGRAINNADPNWPATLQGKAKQFYDRYMKFGKPQGYKLKAMIINFPDGIPGDVGFFLNWKPDVK